jgi:hypothetical protein
MTVATKGTRISRDCAAKPMATSELDSAMTERVARMLALLTVALAPTWSTDCSVPNAARNASCRGVSAIPHLLGTRNATQAPASGTRNVIALRCHAVMIHNVSSVGSRLAERRALGGSEGNVTREPDVARESTPGPSTGVPPPVVACVHPPTPAWEGHP